MQSCGRGVTQAFTEARASQLTINITFFRECSPTTLAQNAIWYAKLPRRNCFLEMFAQQLSLGPINKAFYVPYVHYQVEWAAKVYDVTRHGGPVNDFLIGLK